MIDLDEKLVEVQVLTEAELNGVSGGTDPFYEMGYRAASDPFAYLDEFRGVASGR